MIYVSRSNMFMTHGSVHEGGQGATAERRSPTARGQHRVVRGRAERSSREFGLSLRQAYRYLEQAAGSSSRCRSSEPTVPITLKLPPSTVRLLRAYADGSGLTIGAIVTRALDAFLGALKEAWLSDAQRVAHFKFISTMRLIDCASPSSHRPTTFWCPDASAWSAHGKGEHS